MNNSFVITIAYTVLLGLTWIAVFHYIQKDTPLFYILLFAPSVLIFFASASEFISAAKLRRKWYREMKILELERELQKELWSRLPKEIQEKWFHEHSGMIEAYQKKIRVWRDSD